MDWAPNIFSGAWDGIRNFFGNAQMAGTNPVVARPQPKSYEPTYANQWAADPTYSYWQDATPEEKDAIYGVRAMGNMGIKVDNEFASNTLKKYGLDSSGNVPGFNNVTPVPSKSVDYSKAVNPTAQASQPSTVTPASNTLGVSPDTFGTGQNAGQQAFDYMRQQAEKIQNINRNKINSLIDDVNNQKNPWDTNSDAFRATLAGAMNRVASMMGQNQANLGQRLGAAGQLGGTKAEMLRAGAERSGRKAMSLAQEGLYSEALRNSSAFEQQKKATIAQLLGQAYNAEMVGLGAQSSAAKEALTLDQQRESVRIANSVAALNLDDLEANTADRRRLIKAETRDKIDAFIQRSKQNLNEKEARALSLALQLRGDQAELDLNMLYGLLERSKTNPEALRSDQFYAELMKGLVGAGGRVVENAATTAVTGAVKGG